MKGSLLLCACLVAICTQGGCGGPADSSQLTPAEASGAHETVQWSESAGASGATASDPGAASLEKSERDEAQSESAEASDSATRADCPDPCAEQTGCGQICITMKGPGSSCQLQPTANDLTRPPRSVQFDCSPIPRGPNGYDFGEQGHITLMGDTCAALSTGGPHRIALILACPPS